MKALRRLRHRLSNTRLQAPLSSIPEKLSIGLVTARFKAAHHLSQVRFCFFLHEKHPMQVVGHHLKSQQLHLRVIQRNSLPAAGYSLAQRRQLDISPVSFRAILGANNQLPEDRPSAFHNKCEHVYVLSVVVVQVATAFHRRLFRASKGVSRFLFIHFRTCLPCYPRFERAMIRIPVAKIAVFHE